MKPVTTGSRESRLAPLEREGAIRIRVKKIGLDEALERLFGHAAARQRRVRICFAIEVEAVGAVQVADAQRPR